MNAKKIVPADAVAIARAARLLREGELVAFPTETVYGLGADAGNAAAVQAIFLAKGRPADHPVIVHIADAAALDAWAREVPAGARKLAAAFWPGPLTLIVPRARHVADSVTGGQDSVGLRVPSHLVARALLRDFVAAGGSGLAAPSANRFGHVSPTTAVHVADDLADRVAMILDGGPCAVGIESTIVAFDDGAPVLVRPGGIALADLARILGQAPRTAGAGAPRASGTLASHYAPRKPARLVAAVALEAQSWGRGQRIAVLARTVVAPPGFAGMWIDAPPDPEHYARDLYANLRTLDTTAAEAILIEAPPADPAWLAVRDRLTRAAHGDEDDRG